MNNRKKTMEVFKNYLDAIAYLKLYDDKKNKSSYMIEENTMSEEDYKQKLLFLRGLQYRRELVEKVETTLESLMCEDENLLRLCYIEEKKRTDVMKELNYKERTYYRKLQKAESLFLQVYDY